MNRHVDAILNTIDECLKAVGAADRAMPDHGPVVPSNLRHRSLTRYACHDIVMQVPTHETAPPCSVCGERMEVLAW